MLRAFIIHGWDGYPEEGWFPWAKRELEKLGYDVSVPHMPHAEHPSITDWVSHLQTLLSKPDEQTILIGHSIGCQTIMRYLEQLPDDIKVNQVLFVAGWFTLVNIGDLSSQSIAKPWLETPINFEKVLTHTAKFTAILSTDDPVVPFEQNKLLFEKNLQAQILVTTGGHLGGSDQITELPILLQLVKS